MTVVAWFTATRLIIFVLGVLGAGAFINHRCLPPQVCASPVSEGVRVLNPANVWNKWDVEFYERIAVHGYAHELDTAKGQGAAAYLPLYPMAARALMAVAPGVPFFWIGTLLSNLATLAALILIARALVNSDDELHRVMALTLASAGSFYLSIPYTEGLFLLLVAGSLVAARRGHYELAGLLAGLSATTRLHGFALAAVPALACWLDTRLTTSARWRRLILTGALFMIPVGVYFAYNHQVLGAWDAFVSRQELWGNPDPYPLQAIAGFWQHPTRLTNWIHGGFWFLYAALLARHWRRIPLGEALFCAGVLIITTQQEGFHGTYRYMTPLVPLTLALARDRRSVVDGVLALNLIVGVLMIIAFVTWNRVVV